ncbi:L-selectin [Biomphalaria glabrata]|nr:L-selectin [Biomphalaria glabrata]
MNRMHLQVNIVLGCFITVIEPVGSLECKVNKTFLVDGMCILWMDQKTTWQNAKKGCASVGMYLAIAQSASQILEMVKGLPPNSTMDAWVGGSDIGSDGVFVWDEDQSPVVEEIWQFGRPNHFVGHDDCMYVTVEGEGKLAPCSGNKNALCMYRPTKPFNWFGPNNSSLCHCLDQTCSGNGTCSGANTKCMNGWFGPGCQLRSLSRDFYGPLEDLGDNNDTSCTTISRQPLYIRLRASSFFTWLRIIVKKPDQLGGFTIYFEVSNIKVLCQGYKKLPVDERSIDILCQDGPFFVDTVILEWTGEKNICSVYINGDQNFALLQHISLGSNSPPSNSSLLAVDGRKSPEDSCFQGLPKTGDQHWTLTFKRQKIINEIIIYRKPKSGGYHFMDGFLVFGFNAKGVMMFRYTDPGTHGDSPIIWILTEVSVPMKKIVISMRHATAKRYLELCEVEAFGACAAPDYGLFCEQRCDSRCFRRECHLNGLCIQCARGTLESGECVPSPEAPNSPTLVTKESSVSTKCPTAKPTSERIPESSQLIKLFILVIIVLSVMVVALTYKVLSQMNEEPKNTEISVKDSIADPTKVPSLQKVASGLTQQQSMPSTLPPATEKSTVTITSAKSSSTRIP